MTINLKQTVLVIGLLTMATGAAVASPGTAAEQSAARRVTKKVQPAYPPLARQLRLSGTVKLIALVTPEGKVKTVQITGGHPILAAAAEDAARQWTFEPTPKESREMLVFDFVSP